MAKRLGDVEYVVQDGRLVGVIGGCVRGFMWFQRLGASVYVDGCDDGAYGIEGIGLHVVHGMTDVCLDGLL
jgi:hypothetical protein